MLGLDGWETCDRTNSTYKECPIAQYDIGNSTFVAVHNPSNIPLNEVKVAVTDDSWAIKGADSHVRC